MADDESYIPPYPARAVRREVTVKEEEAEPIFATHKRPRSWQLPYETHPVPATWSSVVVFQYSPRRVTAPSDIHGDRGIGRTRGPSRRIGS